MYKATLCHDGWISIYGFLSTAVPPFLLSVYDILGSNNVSYKFWTQFFWLAIFYGIVNLLLRIKMQKENFQVAFLIFGSHSQFSNILLPSFRLLGEPPSQALFSLLVFTFQCMFQHNGRLSAFIACFYRYFTTPNISEQHLVTQVRQVQILSS